MKLLPLTLLLLLAGFPSPPGIGLLANETTQGDTEKKLRQLEDDWALAVQTNDPKQIEMFFTIDFLFVGAKGILQDRAQHLQDFASGKLHVDKVKILEATVHLYGDAAVVSSKVEVEGTYAGNKINGSYQFTDTWVMQGAKWRAAARQQTKLSVPGGAEVRRTSETVFHPESLPEAAPRRE